MKHNSSHSFRLIALFAISMLAFSCAKEGIEAIEGPTEILFPDAQEIVEASFYGRIVGFNDLPIVGAKVQCHSCVDNSIMTTDSTGNFLFADIENKGSSAYLTVEYPDMFKAFRRFGVVKGEYNYTEIQLNRKTLVGTLTAESGGAIEHDSGASVVLPANGIVDENGQPFNGTYEVYVAWINPSAENLSQNIIGDISGVDNTGTVKALSTFGMLVIEILDLDGNPLNLQEEAIAELKIPVPQELINNAPVSIPLWNYDEELGYWIEDGRAELVNGFYIGTVNHFSSWNVSAKSEAISISGKVALIIENENITPSYYKIELANPTIGKIGYWLCDDGSYLIPNFPAGEIFDLKILDHCQNEIYNQSSGPYQSNKALGQIIINQMQQASEKTITIHGNAVDCDLNPITHGLAIFNLGEKKYTVELEEDGSFLFPIRVCDDFVGYLTIYNEDNLTESIPSVVSELDRNFDFDDILLCDTISQRYSFMNIEGLYTSLTTDEITNENGPTIPAGQLVGITTQDYSLMWNKVFTLNGISNGLGEEGILFGSHVFPNAEWISTENVNFFIEEYSVGAKGAKGFYQGTIEYEGQEYYINGSFLDID